MVKHVILWQLKDELSAEEKAAVKAGIKEGLESLSGKIPGLVDIHVNINALPSSNADLMLDTTFESAEALKGYSTHPAHMAVADSKVRPYYKTASVWTTRCNTECPRTLRYTILRNEITQKGSLHGLCNDPFTIRRC